MPEAGGSLESTAAIIQFPAAWGNLRMLSEYQDDNNERRRDNPTTGKA